MATGARKCKRWNRALTRSCLRGGMTETGTGSTEIRLAELLGALSHALDMVEGQPPGHCGRAGGIGGHIGRAIGLDEAPIWELYYVLLLKDLGCSSNAARICRLFLTDDLAFKRDVKTIG